MTTNDASASAPATCVYCGDDYSAERAEIGYAHCMKKECGTRAKADRNDAPIEIEVVQPETRF